MNTEQAIKLAGSPTALAKLLGITSAAVSQWGDDLPAARVWQLKCLKPEWFEQPAQAAEPSQVAV